MAHVTGESARGGARWHASRARPIAALRAHRAALALLALVAAGACTAPPSLPEARTARIETDPAGALLVTPAGQVLRTPAVLPLPERGSSRIELRLPGFVTRRIVLTSRADPSPLGAASLCTLVPLILDERWERVAVVEGRVRVQLDPAPAARADLAKAP